MVYSEQDIRFDKLTSTQFEELCFDLLLRFGYKGLIWRQGGADNGRDIEGRLSLNNPLVGVYEEKWFFECKHYSEGVPPEALNSKIAWADAEKPKHLVIFTTSYLSNNARTWLEKIEVNKPYKIHIVEGKLLKNIILYFPDIISKYFIDKYLKLLIDLRTNWLVHDLLPEAESYFILYNKLDFTKLSIDELAFLWCASKYKYDEINEWCSDNESFSFDFLFNYLRSLSNETTPIIRKDTDFDVIISSAGTSDSDIIYNNLISAQIVINPSTKPTKAIYTFVRDSEGEGIEVLIEATGDFPTKIRYIPINARTEMINIYEKLACQFSSKNNCV